MYNLGGLVSNMFMHMFLGDNRAALQISTVIEGCSPGPFRIKQFLGIVLDHKLRLNGKNEGWTNFVCDRSDEDDDLQLNTLRSLVAVAP